MKYFLFSDLHLFEKTKKKVSLFLDQFKILAEKEKPDYIIGLGDFYHYRESQTIENLILISDFFKFMDSLGVPCIFFDGNHDKVSQEKDISFLTPFKGLFPNIEMINSPKTIVESGAVLHLSPYYEGEKFKQILQQIKSKIDPTKKNYLLGHYTIEGISKNSFSELKFEEIKEFDLVFSGHIHDRSKSKNFYYIGSCYQGDYSEDTEKGFAILNTKDGKVTFKTLDLGYKYLDVKVEVLELMTKVQLLAFVDKALKQESPEKEIHCRLNLTGKWEILRALDIVGIKQAGVEVKLNYNSTNIGETISSDTQKGKTMVERFEDFCKQDGLDFDEGVKILNLK